MNDEYLVIVSVRELMELAVSVRALCAEEAQKGAVGVVAHAVALVRKANVGPLVQAVVDNN